MMWNFANTARCRRPGHGIPLTGSSTSCVLLVCIRTPLPGQHQTATTPAPSGVSEAALPKKFLRGFPVTSKSRAFVATKTALFATSVSTAAEHTLPPSVPLSVVTGDQPRRDLHHQVVKPGPDHSEVPLASWEAEEAVPTPINTESLKSWLTGYDPKETQFLIQGFTHGFRLMYEGPSTSTFAKNLSSVMT